MVEEIGEKRVDFKREFPCPHCGFMVSVEQGKFIVKPGTKTQYKEYVEVRKSEQANLESEAKEV